MNQILEHPNSEYSQFLKSNPEAARILEPLRELLELSALRDRLANPGKTVDEIVAGVTKKVMEFINPESITQVSRAVGTSINADNNTYGYGKLNNEEVNHKEVVNKVAALYKNVDNSMSITNKEMSQALGLKASEMKTMELMASASVANNTVMPSINIKAHQEVSNGKSM